MDASEKIYEVKKGIMDITNEELERLAIELNSVKSSLAGITECKVI